MLPDDSEGYQLHWIISLGLGLDARAMEVTSLSISRRVTRCSPGEPGVDVVDFHARPRAQRGPPTRNIRAVVMIGMFIVVGMHWISYLAVDSRCDLQCIYEKTKEVCQGRLL